MMFNIRNYRSDNNLQKGNRSSSKQNQRSTSEVKQQQSTESRTSKMNYHFTQKRDLSEGRQVKTPEKQTQPKAEVKAVQPMSQTAKNLEFKLPDLRLYQKPPKPVQASQPRVEKVEQPKAAMTVSQQNTTQLKSRLVMYDDPTRNKTSQSRKDLVAKPTKEFTFAVASLSKAGFDGYQTKTNQDRELVYQKLQSCGAFGVMDGHGMEGDKVSQYVTDVFKEVLQHQFYSFDFTRVFPETHQLLRMHPSISSQFSGTTATLVIIHDNIVECGWVGDSRAILGRKRSPRKVDPVELSKDHKPDQEGERFRIEQSGGHVDSYHSVTGAQLGPYRVWVKGAAYPGLAMSRSLGDQVAASVGVSQIPDVTRTDIKDEDLFLIVASDGVWEFLSNQQVVDIVYPFYLKNDPKGACNQLYTEAHAIWKSFDDGIDDITSVVVFFNRE